MKAAWQDYYMDLAEVVASKSKDPATKVGCVVVGVHNNILATGYNGFARGVDDSEERYLNREIKLAMVVHAEANAVAAAARVGANLYASTAFITKPPCSQCAALLIQAGVYRIVCPPSDPESRWHKNNELAIGMFKEARLRFCEFSHE